MRQSSEKMRSRKGRKSSSRTLLQKGGSEKREKEHREGVGVRRTNDVQSAL
jgi:hypothetical protein